MFSHAFAGFSSVFHLCTCRNLPRENQLRIVTILPCKALPESQCVASGLRPGAYSRGAAARPSARHFGLDRYFPQSLGGCVHKTRRLRRFHKIWEGSLIYPFSNEMQKRVGFLPRSASKKFSPRPPAGVSSRFFCFPALLASCF